MLRASDRWFARHFWKRLMSFFLSSASLTSSRMSRWEWAGAVEEETDASIYLLVSPPNGAGLDGSLERRRQSRASPPLEKVSRQRDTKPNLSIPKKLVHSIISLPVFWVSNAHTHPNSPAGQPSRPKQKIKRREFWCIFSADVYYIYMRLSISVWCVFVLCPFDFICIPYTCVCLIFWRRIIYIWGGRR
jgi:hypothetical protein